MAVLHFPSVLLHSIVALVTFIASVVAHRLVELPLIDIGKELIRMLRGPTRTFKAA
jgi:hypothetical protein